MAALAPYIPVKDALLDAWVTNFSTLLTAASHLRPRQQRRRIRRRVRRHLARRIPPRRQPRDEDENHGRRQKRRQGTPASRQCGPSHSRSPETRA